MRPKFALILALPLALTLAPVRALAGDPEPMKANTGTTRIDFAASEWLDVKLAVQGVSVDRIKLHRPGKMTGLFTKHDETNRGTIVVTNLTDRNVSPAVALAVFDGDGHLLAATNTGQRLQLLKPGETDEMTVHFGGVFRHMDRGAVIYISLEY